MASRIANKLRRQETELFCEWSKKEKDLIFWFPSKPDGSLLNTILCGKRCVPDNSVYAWSAQKWKPSFVDELEKRGYDITTLKFSIRKKK